MMNRQARLLRIMQKNDPESDTYLYAALEFDMRIALEQPRRFTRGIWRCPTCDTRYHGSALGGSPDNGWCPVCKGTVIASCMGTGDVVVGL
jgi:rubrerythrin